jgi:NAD(P)-dependent dehydrogenase (short-subunit alcohol dehydrogenase family)
MADISVIAATVAQIRDDLGEVDALVCSAGTNVRKLVEEITELNLYVALAQLLRRRELQAFGEDIVHRQAKGVGKTPTFF